MLLELFDSYKPAVVGVNTYEPSILGFGVAVEGVNTCDASNFALCPNFSYNCFFFIYKSEFDQLVIDILA